MQQMHQGQIPGPLNPSSIVQPNQATSYGNPPYIASGAAFDSHGSVPQQTPQPRNGNSVAPSIAPPQTAHATQHTSSIPATVPHVLTADDASKDPSLNETQAELKVGEQQTEKKSKKEKEREKESKMIYSDNEISPEEKMAKLSRYAFNPEEREEMVLGDASAAAVTGVDRGYEAPYDKE